MPKKNIQLKIVTTIVLLNLILIPVLATANPAQATHNWSWNEGKFKELFPSLSGKATQELDRRIAKLNELIKTVEGLNTLSDTEKTALKTNLQNEVTRLTSLKTTTGDDFDLKKLLQDERSALGSYSKYFLFMRKTRIIAGSDAVLSSVTRFTEISVKLAQKIQEAKTNGQNVANLETLLADMNAKIADAKVKAQSAKDAVTPLKPEDYPGNKPTLDAARASLKIAKEDIHTARKNAWQIYIALKNLTGTPTPTVTPTATPTSTPTVTPTV
jgi:hypothetical protein